MAAVTFPPRGQPARTPPDLYFLILLTRQIPKHERYLAQLFQMMFKFRQKCAEPCQSR
jgi:hypothetical protein